jgi:F-type H+-transporting ATPase subunit alpha
MKQPQYQPMEVWEMAVILFALNNDVFDGLEVGKALAAEKSMRDYLKSKNADLIARIDETNSLTKEDEEALKVAIQEWKVSGTY